VAAGLKKESLYWLRDHLAPVLAGRLYRLYCFSVRAEIRGWDKVEAWRARGPVIFAHLHGDDLALLNPFRNEGLTLMVSRSKDGELMDRGVRQFGYRTVRGSGTERAVAGLKELVRVIRSGGSVALAVDGPTGPRGVVKPGVVALAKLTGAPIFAGGVFARRKHVFQGTWHKTYLPLPWAKVVFCFDEPILVPADASSQVLEERRLQVEREIERLSQLAGRPEA